ncbi:hypothetical protein L5515_017410 [Caenorhabditis briggsae]|uniref:C2H2-type domain-containing protein n=1 Tax=Caenorhabditis briggsae TaxID=6238 RepID=A0AAE9JRH9_CAEBR|nr:hypothetical protein L5515_017410 [Caenorhabditis briggsae]
MMMNIPNSHAANNFHPPPMPPFVPHHHFPQHGGHYHHHQAPQERQYPYRHPNNNSDQHPLPPPPEQQQQQQQSLHPPPQPANYPWGYTNQRNTVDQRQQNPNFSDSRMALGSNQAVYHAQQLDDSDMMMEEPEYSQFHMGYPEEDEVVEGMITPRAVHQCNVCNKIFVSYKGLQQHAVIHTDQKPFRCDICSKAFRFKSNLFEHRSVHTGFTPHACPYCGKTCRLKGNLKKHLRTHVTSKEELEAAWRPFSSNRRPPADIPEDAIVVRGTGGGPYYTPPPRPKKKKLGLGEPDMWVDKLRRGDLLPQVDLEDKLRRLEDTIFNNMSLDRWVNLFEIAKSIAFETHECPVCKCQFMTRMDCMSHHSIEHENSREGLDYFCEKCFRPFADEDSYNQHMEYHAKVANLIDTGAILPTPSDPDILVPTTDEFQMLFDGTMNQQMMQPQMI